MSEEVLSKITGKGEQAMHLISESEYGLGLSGLTEETNVAQSTWFKAMNHLEEAGIVLRDRNKVYHLTELGEELLKVKRQYRVKNEENE